MSPDRAALMALTRFELRRAIARQGARMGFVLFVAALAIGAYMSWFRGEQPGMLFGEGFLVWMMGLVAFGLATDRRQAFDSYLMRNHTSARVYLASKALAMIALILLAGVVAFALRSAVTAGDFAASAWSAVMLTLVALMIAPLAMVVEGQVDTTMPAAFVLLAYGVAGGLAYFVRQSMLLFELPGLAQLSPGDWGTVAVLAVRASIWTVPAFLVAGALVALNLRRY